MRAFWLLSILLLVSCSKTASVVERRGRSVVTDYDAYLSDLREIPWNIGSGLKRKSISKGIQLGLYFPQFRNEDIMFLYEKKNATSWVVRLSRRNPNGLTDILGYVYAPMIKKNPRTQVIKPANAKSVYFKVVYAAAAPSRRFENFRCPAFGHNKFVKDMELIESKVDPSDIAIARGIALRANPRKMELTPVQYNGGMSLRGTYYADMALYNEKEKRLYSDFIRVHDHVVVRIEGEKKLRGCENFVPPAKPKQEDKFRQFKRGQ